MTSPDRLAAPRGARLRVGLGAAVVLALIGLAVAVFATMLADAGESTVIGGVAGQAPVGSEPGDSAPGGSAPGDSATSPPEGSTTGAVDGSAAGVPVLFVHILGAVLSPGLYELREGDRFVDAIAAAGGFTEPADRGAVNLARRLSDGEQIYVPVVGEAPVSAPGTVGSAPPGSAGSGSAGSATVGGKVDLNAADAAALDTLPGVGPATAARIIEWRETNGRFSAIEDLLSVSGIGEKTFADLEDLVTV